MARERMLSILYTWNTDNTTVTYSHVFKNAATIDRLDILMDAINALQEEYDRIVALPLMQRGG